METLDLKRVVRDFQYKPNFALGVFEKDDKPWIRIIMLVEDSRQPFRVWDVDQSPQEEYRDYYYDPMVRRTSAVSNVFGYSPSRALIEVVGNFPIPKFIEGPDQEQMFVQWLVDMVRGIEDHETFEWLRYKGELINDPHKEK